MPQPAIKGQALADFIVELTTPTKKQPEEAPAIPTEKIRKWSLYVDGSSNDRGLA